MKNLLLLVVFIMFTTGLFAQDDTANITNSSRKKDIEFTTETFESTRILNGHSIERLDPGQLDFRISHRFGTLNSGAYNFFGLDQSNIHLSLEYGITKWLMIGVGRGNYQKTFDGFTKFSVLRQSKGSRVMPVSVSVVTSAAMSTLKWTDPSRTNYFSSRLSYVAQLLIARKFGDFLSLQVTPSYVHRNLVATELDPNDLYSIGVGGRIKLTSMISLNAEYYYLLNSTKYMSQKVYNPLSIGVDIYTGGHTFQLFFTNSQSMIEKGFIGETTGSWAKGDIRFGFNISRIFVLHYPK